MGGVKGARWRRPLRRVVAAERLDPYDLFVRIESADGARSGYAEPRSGLDGGAPSSHCESSARLILDPRRKMLEKKDAVERVERREGRRLVGRDGLGVCRLSVEARCGEAGG